MQGLSSIKVRRGRDSNSRYGSKPHTHLAGGRLQPLGHLSVNGNLLRGKVTYEFFFTKPLCPDKLLPANLLDGIL